jgi:hypothetical protein
MLAIKFIEFSLLFSFCEIRDEKNISIRLAFDKMPISLCKSKYFTSMIRLCRRDLLFSTANLHVNILTYGRIVYQFY